ncbi:MAG: hypothetical protein EAZ91_23245 [Cytophagales bacterium]|nr:MAG: hypothetical protein EAZ91_23245 [Cytophagales bacterium]
MLTLIPAATTYTVGQSVTVLVTGGTANDTYNFTLYDSDPVANPSASGLLDFTLLYKSDNSPLNNYMIQLGAAETSGYYVIKFTAGAIGSGRVVDLDVNSGTTYLDSAPLEIIAAPALGLSLSPNSTTYTVGQSVTATLTGGIQGETYLLKLFDGIVDDANDITAGLDVSGTTQGGANTVNWQSNTTSAGFFLRFNSGGVGTNRILEGTNLDYAHFKDITGLTIVCPPISISVTPSLTVASGTNITLTASSGVATAGTSYTWSNGVQSNSLVVNGVTSTTAFSVTGLTSGCVATTTATVEVVSLTLVSSASPSTVCVGSLASLSVAASGGTGPYTYTWAAPSGAAISGASNTSVVSVSGSTSGMKTFTVTVADGSGTPIRSFTTVDLTVNPSVTASIAGNLTICAGTSTTLTASGGSSFLWSNAASTSAITVSPTSTTAYSVTVSNGGCSATATATVTVNPAVTASIAANPGLTICAGNSTTLTASGGTGFLWSNAASTSAITVSPTSTTAFSVTVTETTTGCSSTTSVMVTVNPAVTASISGNLTICTAGSTTLTASGGTSYLWSDASSTSAITVSPTSTTVYSVTVTNITTGCSSTTSVTVTVNAALTANITPNPSLTICAGTSTTLTATGGTSYAWSNGVNTAANPVSPTSTTAYSVTVSNGGCSATATATVTVNSAVTASISGNLTICAGTSTTLTASGGTGYAWSNGVNTAANPVSPTSTTAFSVTVTNITTGCSSTTSVMVTVNPAVTASIAGNLTICVGTSTTLTASGGTTYNWTGGVNGATLPVSVAGLYSVTATSLGCSATATATVTVNPSITASIAASPSLTICPGSVVMLTASGAGSGGSYRWSNAEQTPAISVGTSGPYTVTATSAGGCSSTAMVTVDVTSSAPLAQPTLSASSSMVCVGGAVSVTATGTGTYQWYKDGPSGVPVSLGAAQQGAVLSLNGVQASQAGSYSVVIQASGCSSATSTAFTLTVNPLPTVTIAFPTVASVNPAGPVITVPVGQGLSYQVFGGGTNGRYERKIIEAMINGYILRTVIENRDGVFLIDRAGPYSITVTDANGCSRTVTGEIVGR